MKNIKFNHINYLIHKEKEISNFLFICGRVRVVRKQPAVFNAVSCMHEISNISVRSKTFMGR
ncbi:MAG: hypothetical protein ACFFCM_04590 [Promethearchaeota archaeon]